MRTRPLSGQVDYKHNYAQRSPQHFKTASSTRSSDIISESLYESLAQVNGLAAHHLQQQATPTTTQYTGPSPEETELAL